MILAIDTSGSVLAVALGHGERMLASSAIRRPLAHDAALVPLIDALLRVSEVSRTELTGVAVITGPGSFTGLRIGLAAGKGLALALDIPLLAVPTFEAMSHAAMAAADLPRSMVPSASPLLICASDARKGDVYHASFRLEHPLKALSGVTASSAAELAAELPEGTWLCGDGAVALDSSVPGKFRIISVCLDVSLAEAAVPIATRMLEHGQTADLEQCEPLYVRDFQTTTRKRHA